MVASDLSELPTEVVRTALKETVESLLKTKKYKINVSSASKAGENNFIGIVCRATFSKEDEGENEENLVSRLILKVAPQNEARRTQFFSRACFLREIYMYNEVLPCFQQFEQSKGVIKEEHGFREYPKCYRFVDEEPSECILLEDLSDHGFTIVDRFMQAVTADHVRLIMKSLGKFHAISFALKNQQPGKFEELASKLDEIFVRRNDPTMRGFFNKQIECIQNAVSGAEDAHLSAKIKALFSKDAIDIGADCLDLEATGAASVISHGDAWQNNTMFRNDKNGNPIELSLIDWQISRHASPIIDIVYFMFCCTTKELRDAHYNDFLEVYYESLSAHVQRLGSDPEKLFPYKLMLEHFRKFAKFGLILASALLPMLTADLGNGINMDELADELKNGKELDGSVFVSEKSQSRLNERMREVVVDMDRLGYI